MTIGQRIQQIRVQHRMSQEEFAAELGTTRQTVSRWELDQTYPEIRKIVLISKLFSVTTDSIIKDGISSFDDTVEHDFVCGVYRSAWSEIVETERFSLCFYCTPDNGCLGTKLYVGYSNKKKLVAICERDKLNNTTEYAYYSSDGKTVIANGSRLSLHLDSVYDSAAKCSMKCLERFYVNHGDCLLPKVSDAGISKCLESWRMSDSYSVDANEFRFHMCTGKTEYTFSISPENEDIYCGASYNVVFDLGMFGGGQFFRIRNYKDNSENFCGFFCDFNYESQNISVPTDKCKLGECITTDKGVMWYVKRYTDDEIVLQGCGDDEYIYRRNADRSEIFTNSQIK